MRLICHQIHDHIRMVLAYSYHLPHLALCLPDKAFVGEIRIRFYPCRLYYLKPVFFGKVDLLFRHNAPDADSVKPGIFYPFKIGLYKFERYGSARIYAGPEWAIADAFY